MKTSLIVPHYEVDREKGELLLKFLSSVSGQYDELIVIAQKIENLAHKINIGLQKASGDFLIVSNNDLTLIKGTLNDLCDERFVTTPKVVGVLDKLFHGHMWCMPRKIFEKVGLMYEGYDGFYYDDSDYWMMIESKGFQIVKKDVIVSHPTSATTLKYFKKEGREEKNRQIFISRWGVEALSKVS
uniref:Glycosyltransferase n=1 Tax=candidate division CPR3 bacterium TaxID=2268181 RepID=A0A7C5YX72_UNCC3